jgi:multidrug efflux system outer membrane protein
MKDRLGHGPVSPHREFMGNTQSKRHRIPSIVLKVFIMAIFSILAGCALGPDYERPLVAEPQAFRAQLGSGAAEPSLADLGWWELFQDAHLQSLIRSALIESKDLRLAVSRVREARAQFGATRADQFPQIDGNTSVQRNQTSGAVARQFGVGRGGTNQEGPTTNQFKATLDLSFEIDLWGKVRRATEAAQAELLGQEWARRTVVLTLVSDVALAYFDLQELDVELEIANLTLKTRQESFEIIRFRKLMGQSSTLDIRRAEQEVARAEAVIPDLERQLGQKENQLSILIGRNPTTIGRDSSLQDQILLPEVPAGLPSALLERRPDILEAEQQLVAANAQIGVAKAAFFPQISLTGNYGAQSLEFSDLFIGSSRIWAFGPSVTVPIFNAGRNRANLEVSRAQQEQALISYEQTIQQAFGEVEDALILHHKTREIRSAEKRLVKVSREALHLAQFEYLNGQATYLDVLVAQLELFNAEIALAQTQRDQLVAVVQVYKAIGGGWSPEPASQALAMQDMPQ